MVIRVQPVDTALDTGFGEERTTMAVAPSERARSVFGSAMSPGLEKAYWYFLRVSGVLLVFLAGGHLFITHYLNVPSETTFDFVSARWANPLWRSFDTLLLLAALWHGLIGLRFSIADYLRSRAARQIGYSLIWVFGVIFTVIGLITIVTFDEEMSRENTGPLSGEMWIGDLLGYSLFAIAVVTYVAIVAVAVWVFDNIREGRSPSDLHRRCRSVCLGAAPGERYRHPLLPAHPYSRHHADRARTRCLRPHG